MQYAFPYGPQLLKRTGTAFVVHHHSRLDAMDADHTKRELEDQMGGVQEQAGSPELPSDEESSLGSEKSG